MRRAVLVAHRWMGLGASVVLAVTGATGAIMVWPGETLAHRAAGRLHENLAFGRPGALVVLAASAAAVLLQLSGLYLWWRRRSVRVRFDAGLRLGVVDLHHAAGILALPLMVLMAGSAIALSVVTPAVEPGLRKALMAWHSAGPFPLPVKALYMAGALAFVVQGVTGVVMWWKKP